MPKMCSITENDLYITERFKKDYNEQFYILVRMHLSFLLDLNTDENDAFCEKGKLKKWNIVSFGKKLKMRNVMEGPPLTQEGICQVYQLIEFLKTGEYLKSEGIFRRTGSVERQQDLKNHLNQGITLQLEGAMYNVHDIASVLKGFLAELPEPLLTEAHFPVYYQIAECCGVNRQPTQETKLLEALQLLLLLLPSENKMFLKDILELLQLTSSYEAYNRMSADNLAKLFTPHLLCPRKLTPEVLLEVSRNLFRIVTFMINNYSELFKVPQKLVLDFRARYERKKILSPSKRLNESVTDAASTVFTFVDHERTTKENESNPTEKALAQLYAHIQSLPESSKKRKLVKQFNKENGHGTPLQVVRSGVAKNKTLGDSIKKHIFQKGLAKKKGVVVRTPSTEDILNTPANSPSLISKTRLFCHHNHNSSSDCTPIKKVKKSRFNSEFEDGRLNEEESYEQLQHDSSVDESNIYLTSTPACLPLRACQDIIFTPNAQDRKSMSPITSSAQRMTRSMQTPANSPSLISKTRLFCHHNHNSSSDCTPIKKVKKSRFNSEFEDGRLNEEESYEQLQHDSSVDESNIYLTSTPACLPLRACQDIIFTPNAQDRKSMSPITSSAQRMTRSMQESIMTPRSRKPVLLVSGTNINTLPKLEHKNRIMDNVREETPVHFVTEESHSKHFTKSKSESDIIEGISRKIEKMNKSESPTTSLSDTFKEYLNNRNMITLSSPVDSSFSSRTDDFNSTDFQNLSDEKMTDSLLYCLDGNQPDSVHMTEFDESEEKELVLKPKQFDEDGRPIIFETSF